MEQIENKEIVYNYHIHKLIRVSVLEGISLIILFFVAMPIKYFLGEPIAVKIAGSIHGILWLIFLYVLYQNRNINQFDNSLSLKLIVLSVVPFGFIYMEKLIREFVQVQNLNFQPKK
ncbi:MAG: DUF3817 domain-containing protein [Aquificae bacterium]|nr:DUF3817 domain-containing protein [Aquificota bacterium]